MELFKLILEVERRVVERSFIDAKHERREKINHPLLKTLYQTYTRWAYEQMLFQYREAHKLQVRYLPKSGEKQDRVCLLRLDQLDGDTALF